MIKPFRFCDQFFTLIKALFIYATSTLYGNLDLASSLKQHVLNDEC